MNECLFCRIAGGDIPAETVYENAQVLAFRDISPQAKSHVLIIPKQHLEGLNDLAGAKDDMLADLLRAAHEVAKVLQIDQTGYRLVSNCGKDAKQSVLHLHFHMLGGEALSERMV
ncbi:MAG: histidine triad nucleotide-binding protein [Clostridiales bacterium]|nr:histidine triad nucleotide-binding protein [Clostridiales bacterium]